MIKCVRGLELQAILIKIQLGCELYEIEREPPRKYESKGQQQSGKFPPNSDLVKMVRERVDEMFESCSRNDTNETSDKIKLFETAPESLMDS